MEVGEITLALVADRDILSNHEHRRSEGIDKNPLDELFGGNLRELLGEVHSVEKFNSKLAELLPLLSKATKRARLLIPL